jgi:DivIVA domain-containing protein
MAVVLVLLGALVIGAVAFGVAALATGTDVGFVPAEPDGVAVPLPLDRPLIEQDFAALRFDTMLRGYRMADVDAALRRAAYDTGYKEELIAVLEAEVSALRAGNQDEADQLSRARATALKAAERAAADATANATIISLSKEPPADLADGEPDGEPAEATAADAADRDSEPSTVGGRTGDGS